MPFRDDLSHHALFYRGQREYLAGITAFARDGLASAEPVLIAIPGHMHYLVSAQLGEDSRQVAYADMAETGRNPARIIPELATFAGQHSRQRVRVIGEVACPGRSAAELAEATRHEALVNLAFAGTAASILCLYDADGLTGPVIGGARLTHSAILAAGQLQASPRYAGADSLPPECERPLPAPPVSAETLSYHNDLRALRRLVTEHARRGGLSDDRAANLVLAASELAANTLRHTTAGGTLLIWQTRLELLCEVQDQGWIADPLAGRRRPPATAPGQGLWVVNQVCDLVELRSGPAGTTIRLHMRLPRA